MIVKVNWSGGKDSTCAVFKHLEAGHTVKAVCYVPMLNETIPLISKAHYDFIIRTKRKFEEMGATVFLVHGMTYYEYVTHIAKQGKFKGKIFGFPYLASGQCGFKRDSKLKALTEMDIGAYDYEDIGIAHDENRRKSQLNEKKRSILDEMGFTENDALFICAEHKILSPIYVTGKRDGCIIRRGDQYHGTTY